MMDLFDLPVLRLDPARDIETVRVLAHPLRLRLLGLLRRSGPATASQLAVAVGESSGLTSYHLRQLAQHDLVVDAPDHNRGRERYWQAAHRMTEFRPSGDDPEGAGAEYLRSVAEVYADRILRYARDVDLIEAQHGQQWRSAYDMSDAALQLTAGQAAELRARLHEVLDEAVEAARRRGPDPEARTVSVQVMLLPPGGIVEGNR